MSAFRGSTVPAETVEKFKPTSGYLPGITGLVVVAFGIGYVVLEVHTRTGLSVGLGLAFFGVLVWVTQLRSRASVSSDTLLLRNSLTDVAIPLHLIDEVSVRRTLNVWVRERRYVCIGIGRSMSSIFKETRAKPLGLSRLNEYAEAAKSPALDQSATAYEIFVAQRIEELAAAATRSVKPDSQDHVSRHLAWPELLALTVSAAAFVLSLV